MEDTLTELEALQKALQEGIEAYDKMQGGLITAKQSPITKILTSKNVKATLLEVVESGELNRFLLTLLVLDESIANAHGANQKQAAAFMESLVQVFSSTSRSSREVVEDNSGCFALIVSLQ